MIRLSRWAALEATRLAEQELERGARPGAVLGEYVATLVSAVGGDASGVRRQLRAVGRRLQTPGEARPAHVIADAVCSILEPRCDSPSPVPATVPQSDEEEEEEEEAAAVAPSSRKRRAAKAPPRPPAKAARVVSGQNADFHFWLQSTAAALGLAMPATLPEWLDPAQLWRLHLYSALRDKVADKDDLRALMAFASRVPLRCWKTQTPPDLVFLHVRK